MKKIIALVFLAAFNIPNSFAQWTLQYMPAARGQLQSAMMGDMLFLIGGCDNNLNVVSTVDLYDCATGTWMPPTNLSSARCFTASVGGDSALYIAGGVTGWSNVVGSKVLDIYKKGTWSVLTLPDSSCFGQALHVGNKILFAGHLKRFNPATSTLVPSNLVFVYDELTKTMSVDTLSQARTFVAAATDGIIGIFAGGSSGFNQVSNVVDIYNSVTDTWTTATLSQARTNFAGIYAGGKFFFAGGAGPGLNLSFNTVDIFDGTNWSTSQLSLARAGVVACAAGDKVIFAGGGDVDAQYLQYTNSSSVVDIYNISQGTWTTNSMNATKVTHTGMGAGTKVYVAGGLSGGSALDAFEIYDVTSGIGNSSYKQELKIAPNPSAGEFLVQLPDQFAGSVFCINDLAGRTVHKGTCVNSNTPVDITHLERGIYFLTITGSNLPAIRLIKL